MSAAHHVTLRFGAANQTAHFVTFDVRADGPDEALEKIMAAIRGAVISHACAGDPVGKPEPHRTTAPLQIKPARIQYPELRGRALFAHPPEPALSLTADAPPLFGPEAASV